MSSKQTYIVDGNKTPQLIDKFFIIDGDGNPRQVQTLYLCNNKGEPQPIYKSSTFLKNISGYQQKYLALDAGESYHSSRKTAMFTWTAIKDHYYFVRIGVALYRPEFERCQCRMYVNGKTYTVGQSVAIHSGLDGATPSKGLFVDLQKMTGTSGNISVSVQGSCSAGASSGGVGRIYMVVDVTEIVEANPSITANEVWELLNKSVFYGEKEFEL